MRFCSSSSPRIGPARNGDVDLVDVLIIVVAVVYRSDERGREGESSGQTIAQEEKEKFRINNELKQSRL